MGSAAASPSDRQLAQPIRLLLSDVDGVMTGGELIFDSSGGETKQFHVRDGMGIKVWMAAGLDFGIISSRNSPIVTRRAGELGIRHVLQGIDDKLSAAIDLAHRLDVTPHQIAYIGDDLPDLPVLRWVGLSIAPADACADCLANTHWQTRLPGGRGAVREAIERLMRARSLWEESVSA